MLQLHRSAPRLPTVLPALLPTGCDKPAKLEKTEDRVPIASLAAAPHDAFKVRDFGAPVIIKGKPDESELVKPIRSKGQDEAMPPPEHASSSRCG